MDYIDWIEHRKTFIPIEQKSFSVRNGIKAVHVYNYNDTVHIKWYINNELIETPIFPMDIIDNHIYPYLESLKFKYISDNLLYEISQEMGKYLPYLESKNYRETNCNHWIIEGEIKL